MLKYIAKQNINVFCDLPFTKCKIANDGTVSQCCYQDKPIGNIFKEKFYDIWNGKISKSIQESTLRNELHPICKGWNACPFIGQKLIPKPSEITKGYPQILEIDLPGFHCNIGGINPSDDNPACIMCPRNSPQYRSSHSFKEDNTDVILNLTKHLFAYLKEFTILGVAEPFWKDKIFDVFDKVDFKKYKDNIFFTTFTNGTIFGEKVVDRFLEYTNSSMLFFSIDAATPETYIKIRRQDFYDLIKRNITKYCSKISQMKQENITARTAYNINLLNVHEMPLMVEESKEMGVHAVQFNPTHTCMDMIDLGGIGLDKKNLKIFMKYRDAALDKGKEVGIRIDMFRDFESVASQDLVQLRT